MLAVAVGDFYNQLRTAYCKDGTNYLMPDGSSFIDKDTLASIAWKMGVYFKRFYRLPVGNILANHYAVDRGAYRCFAKRLGKTRRGNGVEISLSFEGLIGGRYAINGFYLRPKLQQASSIRLANQAMVIRTDV
jgi:hypothetical protein